ncbi:hypothetical protein MGSAQ_000862 [marine sediment metagenome]|uniref:Uncharacterized protein n=1 Tax=marine sediment metagenome TaxID=412755 RepID=A0A1B6NW89_9ZZZZ
MKMPVSDQPCSSSPIRTRDGSADRVVLPVPDRPKKIALSSGFPGAWLALQCIGMMPFSGSR